MTRSERFRLLAHPSDPAPFGGRPQLAWERSHLRRRCFLHHVISCAIKVSSPVN